MARSLTAEELQRQHGDLLREARFLQCPTGYLLQRALAANEPPIQVSVMAASVWLTKYRVPEGVYLYGKLRRTDFLPVGEDKEEEVLERGWDSETSSDNSEHGIQYYGGLSGAADGMNSEEDSDGMNSEEHTEAHTDPTQMVDFL